WWGAERSVVFDMTAFTLGTRRRDPKDDAGAPFPTRLVVFFAKSVERCFSARLTLPRGAAWLDSRGVPEHKAKAAGSRDTARCRSQRSSPVLGKVYPHALHPALLQRRIGHFRLDGGR